MAALVGYVQQAWNASASATLSLSALTAPGGGTVAAAAGQMALVEADHGGSRTPLPSGWTPCGAYLWWKVLTAEDIAAGSVLVRAYLTSLTVLSGAAGVGRTNDWAQVKVRSASGGLFVRGWTSRWRDDLGAGSTYRVGAETSSPEDSHRHAVYFRAASAAGYLSLPDADWDAEFYAYEILAPAAPLAPTPTSPPSGANVDRDLPVLLSSVHNSAAGLLQTRCKVVIRASGGAWGSVKADGTIAAGDTTQELAQAGGVPVTIAAGVLTAGTLYEWIVYTEDAAGWSPASPTSTFAARSKPTATVAFAAAAEDLSPTISGTITPGTGTPRAIWLRVCPAGDGTPDAPIWESGQIAITATSYSVDVPSAAVAGLWVNGASYKAWVQPMDAALLGAWTASAADDVSWTAPAAPSAISAADGSPPMLTGTGIPAGSTRLEVQAAPVGADAWRAVVDVPTPASSVTVADPLSVFGVPCRYRTRRWALVDGVELSSAWVESAAITSTDMAAYVVAVDGSAWVQVHIVDAGALVPIQGVSRSTGLGDVAQRVDKTMVAGFECWWECETDTADDEATLRGWVTDPDRLQLWLRPTPERSFTAGPVHGGALLTAAMVAKVSRIAQANLAARHVRWDWITQDEED